MLRSFLLITPQLEITLIFLFTSVYNKVFQKKSFSSKTYLLIYFTATKFASAFFPSELSETNTSRIREIDFSIFRV